MRNIFKKLVVWILVLTMVLSTPIKIFAQVDHSDFSNGISEDVNKLEPVKPVKLKEGQTSEDLVKNPKQPDIYTLRTNYMVQKLGEYKINYQPYIASVGESATEEEKTKINKRIELPDFSGYIKPDPESFINNYDEIVEAAKNGEKTGDEKYGFSYQKNRDFKYKAMPSRIKVKHIFQKLDDFTKYTNPDGSVGEDGEKITYQSGDTGSLMRVTPLDENEIKGFVPERQFIDIQVPVNEDYFVLEYRYNRVHFNVNYDSYDGTPVSSRTLFYEQEIPKIADAIIPSKIGYDFVGWKPSVDLQTKDGKTFKANEIIKDGAGNPILNLDAQLKMPAQDVTFTAEWQGKTKTDYAVQFWAEKSDHADDASLLEKYDYIGTHVYRGVDTGYLPDLDKEPVKNIVFPDLDQDRLEKIWRGDKFDRGRYKYLDKFFVYNKDLTDKENADPRNPSVVKSVSATGETIYNIYYDRQVYDLYFTKSNALPDYEAIYPEIWGYDEEQDKQVMLGGPGNPYHYKARFNQLMEKWPNDAMQTKGFDKGWQSYGWGPNYSVPNWPLHLDTPPYRLNAEEFLDMPNYTNWGGYVDKIDDGAGGTIDARSFKTLSFGVKQQTNSMPHFMDYWLDGFKDGETIIDYDLFMSKADTSNLGYGHRYSRVKGFTPYGYKPGGEWPVIREDSVDNGRIDENQVDELNDERNDITPFPDKQEKDIFGISTTKGTMNFISSFFSETDEYGDPLPGNPFKTNGYIRFKYKRNKYPLRFNYDPRVIKDDSEFNSANQLDTFYQLPLKTLSPDLIADNLEKEDKEYYKDDPKNLLDNPKNLETLGLTSLIEKDAEGRTRVKKPSWVSDQAEFKGWAFDPAGKKMVWENKSETMPDHPVNLYAIWGEPDYKWKVTFDSNGGKLRPIKEEDLTTSRKTIREGDIEMEEENTYARKEASEGDKQVFTVIQRQKLVRPSFIPVRKGYDFMGWEIVRFKMDKNGEYTDEVDNSYREEYGVPELYSFGIDVVEPTYLKAIWVPNDRVDVRVEHYLLDADYKLDESISPNPRLESLEEKRARYLVSTTGYWQSDKHYLTPHQELIEKLPAGLKKDYEEYNKRVKANNSFFQEFTVEADKLVNELTGKLEDNPKAENNVFKFFYNTFKQREYKVNYIDESFKGLENEKDGALINQDIVRVDNLHYDARNYRPIAGWVLTSKPQQQIFFDLDEKTNELTGINGTGKDEITFYYKDVRVIEVPGDKTPPDGYVRVTFKAEEGGSFGKDDKGKDIKELHYDVIKGLKSDLIPVPQELKEGEDKESDKYYISPDSGRKFIKWDNSRLLNPNTILEKDYSFTAYFDWEEIKINRLVVTEAFIDPNGLWTNDFAPTVEKLKEQVKSFKNKIEETLPAGAEVVFGDDIDKLIAESFGEHGKSDKEELVRDIKIPAKIKYAENSIRDIEIPVKVYKNVYEASTNGDKTLFLAEAEKGDLKDVTGDYVKVTVNPTAKPGDKDTKIYYVNKNAWVEIPEIKISDEEKAKLGFLNWTADQVKQNENKKENGVYDFAKRHKFTEDTVIYPIFSKDIIPQEGGDKPEVPTNFVKVIVRTTDKATDETAFEKIFWVNPTKEVAIPVANPVGKQRQVVEIPGLGTRKVNYSFEEWQKVKVGESDDSLKDIEPERIDLARNKYTDKVTLIEAVYKDALEIEKIVFTVEKVWDNSTDLKLETGDYPTMNFTLYRKLAGGKEEKVQGVEVKEITKETTTAIWEDLPQIDSEGREYSYFVKETFKDNDVKNDNWTLGKMESGDGKNTITNKLKTRPDEGDEGDPEKNLVATLTVKKVLENEPVEEKSTMRMMSRAKASDPLKFKFKISGPYGYVEEFELSANETKTLDKLAYGEYKVEEIDSKGYKAEYSKEKISLTKESPKGYITVTNKNIKSDVPSDNIINVTVKKLWVGGGEKPQTTIELWRKGYDVNGKEYEQKVGEFKTEAKGLDEQSQEFKDLAKHDPSGREFTYYAKELDVPEGYTASYSEDKLTITNGLNIIKDPTPEDKSDKPEGYVIVTFKPGDHGKIDGDNKDIVYYVNPKADPVKVMKDLTEPAITADIGYKVAKPSWKDEDGKALDKATEIIKDLTYIAQYDKLDDIIPGPGNDKPEGYVTVTFKPGDHGKIDEDTKDVVYYVNPKAGVKIRNLRIPSITANTGYKIADPSWKSDSGKGLDMDTSITKNLTYIAQYDEYDNIIKDPTPEDNSDKPKGYVTVTFKPGDHGKLDGDTKDIVYYVNPKADPVKVMKDLTEPKITADIGYKVAKPSWKDVDGKALDKATEITKDLTYIAQYDKLDDIIPGPGNDKPEGYVTVRFITNDNGTLTGITSYYVNPEAGKKMADITAPTINANEGYRVANPNWSPDFTDDDSVIKEDRIYVANYECLEKAEITYISMDINMGTVSLDSEEIKDEEDLLGSTAEAKKGYKFVKWIDTKGNKVSDSPTYVPSEKESATYIAVFEKIEEKPVPKPKPAKPEPRPEPDPGNKPDHKPEVKPEPRPEPKPEPKPLPKPAKPEPRPEPKPDKKPQVKPQQKPSPGKGGARNPKTSDPFTGGAIASLLAATLGLLITKKKKEDE